MRTHARAPYPSRTAAAPPQVLPHTRVRRVHVTPFHAAGHERPVRVLDDSVDLFLGARRIDGQIFLVSLDRLVESVTGLGDRLQSTVLHHQVRSDDDPDVVDLKALAGVDAADFADRLRGDDPQTPVLGQIPPAGVLADDDVVRSRIAPAPLGWSYLPSSYG